MRGAGTQSQRACAGRHTGCGACHTPQARGCERGAAQASDARRRGVQARTIGCVIMRCTLAVGGAAMAAMAGGPAPGRGYCGGGGSGGLWAAQGIEG